MSQVELKDKAVQVAERYYALRQAGYDDLVVMVLDALTTSVEAERKACAYEAEHEAEVWQQRLNDNECDTDEGFASVFEARRLAARIRARKGE